MASELRLECKFQMAEMEEQLRALKAKVEALEKLVGAGTAKPVTAEAPRPAPEPEVAEEVLLAISAAVAAFLGKRAHVRQVRLVSSMAWAQHGRASIQASHGIVVQR